MKCFYHVAPRYTPGSPALVSERIALSVAKSEKFSIHAALEGAWGDEQRLRAERLGLRGIAELREERKKGYLILDLCTGEYLYRLYDPGIEKAGYRRFFDLDPGEQRALKASPPPGVEDVEREWYKIDFALGAHMTKDVKVYRPEVLTEEQLRERKGKL